MMEGRKGEKKEGICEYLIHGQFLTISFESHFDWKEIKPVLLKENQSWMFIGRIDIEAETPIQ